CGIQLHDERALHCCGVLISGKFSVGHAGYQDVSIVVHCDAARFIIKSSAELTAPRNGSIRTYQSHESIVVAHLGMSRELASGEPDNDDVSIGIERDIKCLVIIPRAELLDPSR